MKKSTNWCFLKWYQRPDLNRHRLKNPRDFKSLVSTNSTTPAKFYGGDTRIRTGDKDFADLCLTTWRCRQNKLNGAGDEIRTRDNYVGNVELYH